MQDLTHISMFILPATIMSSMMQCSMSANGPFGPQERHVVKEVGVQVGVMIFIVISLICFIECLENNKL